jgi:hypothetical protein
MASRTFLQSVNQKRGPRKSDGPQPSSSSSGGGGSGLTKKVGGWVFGKWGNTPAPAPASPTITTTRPTSSHSQQTTSTMDAGVRDKDVGGEGGRKKEEVKKKLRPSGVNQNGPIWGFFDDVPELQSKVVVQDYDAVALGEALAEAAI